MFKFHIKGFAACNDPYYYSSSYPVDIKVNAETKTEAVAKASNFVNEGIAGGKIWTGARCRDNGVPQEMKQRWVKYI